GWSRSTTSPPPAGPWPACPRPRRAGIARGRRPADPPERRHEHGSDGRALVRGGGPMRRWQPARLAGAAGARLVAAGAGTGAEPGPRGASVDSRTLAPGELFIGLRGEGGARVVAITGSTGKTSTKDILAALLSPHLRVVASPENLNTEIGMPLAMLAAPAGTELLVLEMAMRGEGQIAELTSIARPDV